MTRYVMGDEARHVAADDHTTLALDPDRAGSVDEHVGHAGSAQEGLERAETVEPGEDGVDELGHDLLGGERESLGEVAAHLDEPGSRQRGSGGARRDRPVHLGDEVVERDRHRHRRTESSSRTRRTARARTRGTSGPNPSNPVSMRAALTTLSSTSGSRRTIAVLGDMLELGEKAGDYHRDIGICVAELGIGLALVTGAFARQVCDGAISAGMPQSRIQAFDSLPDLAAALAAAAGPDDVVLLKGSRGMQLEKVLELLDQTGPQSGEESADAV